VEQDYFYAEAVSISDEGELIVGGGSYGGGAFAWHAGAGVMRVEECSCATRCVR